MRVTFLRDKIRADEGGASFSLHLMAEQLSERGCDVEVVTVHHSGQKNVVPESHNYTITEKPLKNYTQIDGAAKVYRILNEINTPDVLHSFQPQLHPIVGAWKQRNPSIPVIGRLNTYQNFCTNAAKIDDNCYSNCTLRKKVAHHPDPSITAIPKMVFDTWVQQNFLNEFDLFFAISPVVKEIFSEYGIDSGRIKVVPNFYEPEFGPEYNDSSIMNQNKNNYRIIYVGRLANEKGLHLLMKALHLTKAEMTVDIIGDGEELEDLKSNAPDNVKFHGWVDHTSLPKYYKRADVFVHPCLWPEPFGRTILESMQYGCVPIVSDVGGPPWIIGDAGITVPRGDVESLADAIESLATAEERKHYINSMSEELERFIPEHVIEQVEETYKTVIGRNTY